MTRRTEAVYNYGMVDMNMPWSLKGISDEAREYAKVAAAEADMPVGAWLTTVIRAAAALEDNGARGSIIEDDLSDLVRTDARPSADDSNTIERAVRIVSDFGLEPEGPAKDTDLIGRSDKN